MLYTGLHITNIKNVFNIYGFDHAVWWSRSLSWYFQHLLDWFSSVVRRVWL